MAKKNYYAVKSGRETGIFESWDECKAQVNGFAGAEFKGFATREEAEQYLGAEKPKSSTHDAYDAVAYVDGSYSSNHESIVGGGGIIYAKEKEIKFTVSSENKELCSHNNVSGEILAAVSALNLAAELGIKSLLIIHDNEGVGKWGNDEWKANYPTTQAYKECIQFARREGLQIDFEWVAGHSGNEGNELADRLSKSSIGLAAKVEDAIDDVASAASFERIVQSYEKENER